MATVYDSASQSSLHRNLWVAKVQLSSGYALPNGIRDSEVQELFDIPMASRNTKDGIEAGKAFYGGQTGSLSEFKPALDCTLITLIEGRQLLLIARFRGDIEVLDIGGLDQPAVRNAA